MLWAESLTNAFNGFRLRGKNHQIKYASSRATWYRVVFKLFICIWPFCISFKVTEWSENLHSNLVVSDISPIIGSIESHRDDITGCDVVVLIIRALAWLRDVWWELELLNMESANCLMQNYLTGERSWYSLQLTWTSREELLVFGPNVPCSGILVKSHVVFLIGLLVHIAAMRSHKYHF